MNLRTYLTQQLEGFPPEAVAEAFKHIGDTIMDKDPILSITVGEILTVASALNVPSEIVAELLLTQRCRVCGCTDGDCEQCVAKTGKPCHWIERDLCSACATVKIIMP
jgi:hypothetical protein